MTVRAKGAFFWSGFALDGVMLDLAHQIVRDGEGATKFVEITVSGAEDEAAAAEEDAGVAEAAGGCMIIETSSESAASVDMSTQTTSENCAAARRAAQSRAASGQLRGAGVQKASDLARGKSPS